MNHHRCTGCKEESYPRHKRGHSGVFGVYCERCLRWVRGGGVGLAGGGWLGSLWGGFLRLVGYVTAPFRGERTQKQLFRERERADYARMKAMEVRARRIPMNQGSLAPQKR